MKSQSFIKLTLACCLYLLLTGSQYAVAQTVQSQISTRETWVGLPVVYQIEVANAADHDRPELPEIDGLKIQSAGPPSSRSSLSIINGRRSQKSSVVYSWRVTPREPGTYTIPPIRVKVDGKNQTTAAQRFVVTKSETGDLLFVELEGKQDRVYVGQPVDMTLKIWIKPYRDQNLNVKLSSADMWQMISQQQTDWGLFGRRMEELAESGQQPRGREQLRIDDDGNERSYYVYEIDATVYPDRPGKIDGDDVHVVVSYPTALGKRRDPFADFFGDDSPFGPSMFDDRFFGGSPFGNRLAVTSVRPVTAVAKAASTDVVPVPTAGSPDDYRGAVGQYQILTQAENTSVAAGDPITLNIGIVGTGPMDLVQAPPLSSIPTLTADFKVPSGPLAGFVDGNQKVFTTTVRPRRAGITEIPAIPFSFFDPDQEKFVTVHSQPISITVEESESLALNSIVASSRQTPNDAESSNAMTADSRVPDFEIYTGSQVLSNPPESEFFSSWFVVWILPPLIFVFAAIFRAFNPAALGRYRFRSAAKLASNEVSNAETPQEVATALEAYCRRRIEKSKSDYAGSNPVGAFRAAGYWDHANRLDDLLTDCRKANAYRDDSTSLESLKARANELIGELESCRIGSKSKTRQRRVRQKWTNTTASLFLAGCTILHAGCALAIAAQSDPLTDTTASIQLTASQKSILLDEATDAYQRAMQLREDAPAESKALFQTAADKFELLANSGVENAKLHFNLANALWNAGNRSRAIAHYYLARKLDPFNPAINPHLDHAQSSFSNETSLQESNEGTVDAIVTGLLDAVFWINRQVNQYVSMSTVQAGAVIAWSIFWIALAVRLFWRSKVLKPVAILALVAFLGSFSWATVSHQSVPRSPDAIAVESEVSLRDGPGAAFKTSTTVHSAEGKVLRILDYRSGWYRIELENGTSGWVESDTIVPISS